MNNPEADPVLEAVASLAEPVRRDLYAYVAQRGEEVSREDAAAAVGVSRGLAAFHLDRLVAAGLLSAAYRRLSGKTGPGAGRPSKMYRRSDQPFEITLPRRRHAMLADLLAEAVDATSVSPPGEPTAEALRSAARRRGLRLGREARSSTGARRTRARLLDAAEVALREHGYEPYRPSPGEIRLRNCPFHPVSRRYPPLVCGMNIALIQGLLDGLGLAGVGADFEPDPAACCVVLRSAGPSSATSD
ncbi:MAG: helix-turn-helix transcriptional regulator [Candidatus Limnocylindria bacterium]